MRSNFYHCIVEEYDKLNDKHIEIKDITYVCETMPNIKYYSFILHDKDIDTRKHYHINLVFGNSGYELKSVLNHIVRVLEININCVGVKISNANGMCENRKYLTHSNKPHKYQYDLKEVYTNNLDILSDCLSNLNPFDKDIINIIYLVKLSKTKAELYSKLGLGYSNHYYKIINDLWNMKSSL